MKLRNKKTGEVVVEVNKIGLVWNRLGMPAEIGQYDSLAELNEEWEDYKPKEPLIKDEKIRKAVRAWAEANNIESNCYHDTGIKFNPSEHRLTWIDTSIEFDENTGLENLRRFKIYTIAELCGEELKMPAEPLIKDEKIRKSVRAWAEANDYGNDEEYQFEDFSTGWKSWSLEHKGNGDDNEIHFNGGIDFEKMNHQGYYTIDELCGEEEAPEPLEPAFVDLDERIKDKEEE